MRFHFALVVLSTLVAARPSTPRHQWPLGPWSETESSPAEDLYGALAGSTIEVVRTQATYFTRGAAFGPRVTQAEGLRGTLIPISAYYHEKHSIYACASNSSDRISRATTKAPPTDWIALVERGGDCSFVEKVRTAQGLGAIAVVVGDAPSPNWKDNPENSPEESDPGLAGKRLLTMFANGEASDIEVPSTFVTRVSCLIRSLERHAVLTNDLTAKFPRPETFDSRAQSRLRELRQTSQSRRHRNHHFAG